MCLSPTQSTALAVFDRIMKSVSSSYQNNFREEIAKHRWCNTVNVACMKVLLTNAVVCYTLYKLPCHKHGPDFFVILVISIPIPWYILVLHNLTEPYQKVTAYGVN